VADAAGLSDTPEEWLEAFEGTREAWARAFEGAEQTKPEEALTSIGAGMEVEEDRSARRCARCDGWIPTDRAADPRALYCSTQCRRATEREREGRNVPPRKRVAHGPDLEWDVGRTLVLTLSRSLDHQRPNRRTTPK
jgi:hypothetical protein